MALFDPERKRIVLRVVYDGPGFAGKTTNLQRLCKSFSSWRRSDMVSPNTLGERTQYFDWLEVDGGLLHSYPIRAQLLTVPGQRELTLRRKFVIERADVVVFVADSRPDTIAESRHFYAELCEQLASFPEAVPLIFQANKQDLPGALPPPKLVAQVCKDLRKPDQVRKAVASRDDGVKQTLALALRLGSEQLRKRWKASEVKAQTGDLGDAASTLAALEHTEAAKISGLEEPPRPVLPSTKLPSTHIWPPISGRAVLEQLAGVELHQVSGLGDLDRLTLEGGGWRMATSTARLYPDVDAGLQALWQLTRRKVALASWLPEPCAVALQPAEDPADGFWLWTVDPVLPALDLALRGDDPDQRRAALSRYAEVCVGAEALAERHQLLVDLDPGAFAVQEGDRSMTRYLGERLDAVHDANEDARWSDVVAGAVLSVAERFARDEIAVADFTESLCLGLHHAPLDEQRRTRLREAFLRGDAPSAAAGKVRLAAARVLRMPAAAPE
ncbi:MAG: hypothetical protein KC431_09415 [Myxococcales bacterium]|nr:hypothetical protein [Myxococcales bacterium]